MTASVQERASAGSPRSRTGLILTVTCLFLVLVRLGYLDEPLRPDEGGYLMVARDWHRGGEFLYGDYHVDRPPGLILLFRVAVVAGDDRVIRLLAIGFAVLLVLAVARAAFLAAGPRSVPWAAFVAAAFAASPTLAADQVDGELFAAPLVAASMALALDGWRRQTAAARFGLAVGAGVLAAAATLVKQNFLEGFLFAAVLVIAECLRQRRLTRSVRDLVVGVVVGGALPVLAAVVWAAGVGIGDLEVWRELAGFRQEAFAAIWSGHLHAVLLRAGELAGLAVVSGMAGIAWTWVARGRPRTPVTWAVGVSLAVGFLSVVAGGSYWPHYLLELAPALAVGTGIVSAGDDLRALRMRWWAVAAAASSLVAALASVVVYATVPSAWSQERTGQWLHAASRPGDTAVVAYGNPSILEAAGLPSPYPYLWSLPMRTLDPDQARLRRTLAGPRAPTWFVVVTPLNSWDIDSQGRLRTLVARRYDTVATVCGYPVWLRTDLSRGVPPVPDC